jgi:hypothetical protein
MPKPRLLPTLTAVLCAVAVPLLSGCGGGSNEAVSAPPASAAADSTPAAKATATATPKAKPGKLTATPTGSVLKLGSPAVIKYDDASTHAKSVVRVTPESIVKGKKSDFANVQLDGDAKTATPYYVKVHTENVGKGNLSKTDPAGYLNAVDDRGQRQSAVIFLGTFDACSHTDVKSLKAGESYDTCQVYMIPKGGSVKGMVWVLFDESRPDKADINWK